MAVAVDSGSVDGAAVVTSVVSGVTADDGLVGSVDGGAVASLAAGGLLDAALFVLESELQPAATNRLAAINA